MRPYLALAALAIQAILPAGVLGLSAGEKAPPFSAPSTQGPVHLGDFLGRKNVVLAYYYRDFTPV